MTENKPTLIKVDFKDIRNVRQKLNNHKVYESITSNNVDEFNKNINPKELERTINNDLSTDFETFWNKCRSDDWFAKIISSKLSKLASRQGTKDEQEQIRISNLTSSKCGVNIKTLSASALRPTKNGVIINEKYMKKKKITKDECLKSFDGEITGKIKGYISAKVAFGSGGHQDNVFNELDDLANWWREFKKHTQEVLVLMIETDLDYKVDCLIEKYKHNNNIIIANHYSFQEFIINNYYDERI
jgi:hypothetical protein